MLTVSCCVVDTCRTLRDVVTFFRLRSHVITYFISVSSIYYRLLIFWRGWIITKSCCLLARRSRSSGEEKDTTVAASSTKVYIAFSQQHLELLSQELHVYTVQKANSVAMNSVSTEYGFTVQVQKRICLFNILVALLLIWVIWAINLTMYASFGLSCVPLLNVIKSTVTKQIGDTVL